MRAKKLIREALLATAAAAMWAGPAAAADVIPVVNGTFMGGQYFFKGDRSSLSGNASLLAAPTVKVNDRWSYVPIYSGNYQGTKGVGDYVGPGTIFQQEMDQLLSVTAVYAPDGSDWRIKPTAGYKYSFLKETRDEAWGHGLFDFEKINAGLSVEKIYRDPFSYGFSLDLFRIRFPNYSSLESQVGTDPTGDPLNRELSAAHVLDTWNVQLSATGNRPFPWDDPAILLQGGYSLLYQRYGQQNLVDARGQLDHPVRQDFLQTLSGAATYPRVFQAFERDWRVDSRFGVSAAFNSSNQNSFDAGQAQYIDNSYSYLDFGAGPSFTLKWGQRSKPTWVSAGFQFERQQYLGRLAQDSGGLYTGMHEHEDRYTLTLAYGYPISQGFQLKAQSNFFWSRSNMTFEQTYPYNYRTENFLLGFTYEY